MLKSKANPNAINIPLIITTLIMIVGVPYLWLSWMSASLALPNALDVTLTAQHSQPTATRTPGPNDIDARLFVPTSRPPRTPTPYPTYTPYPTSPPWARDAQVFEYSYYNPMLGGANCYDWDYARGDCRSSMASGHDWREYYGYAVACPPDIPLGSIVRVIYPPEIARDWICLDRGGAIKRPFLDFLDTAQRIPWRAPVVAYILPATPLPEVSPGTH